MKRSEKQVSSRCYACPPPPLELMAFLSRGKGKPVRAHVRMGPLNKSPPMVVGIAINSSNDGRNVELRGRGDCLLPESLPYGSDQLTLGKCWAAISACMRMKEPDPCKRGHPRYWGAAPDYRIRILAVLTQPDRSAVAVRARSDVFSHEDGTVRAITTLLYGSLAI